MKKQTKEKKNEPKTQIITDIETMQFNANHQMWWTIDDNDKVIDKFTYDDFLKYIMKMIQNQLDNGSVVVTVETNTRIEITTIKNKKKKHLATFFMCNEKEG